MSAEQGTVAAQIPSRSRSAVVAGVSTLMFLLGAGGLVYALASDPGRIDFPLFTVSLLYLMGVTQGGIVFCAILRLVGAHWSKPYYRVAELATLAFAPFALLGFLLIYFCARGELFYWLSPGAETGGEERLSPWLDAEWLLARNLLALVLFYGLSAIYAWKALRPDLAALRGDAPVDHDRTERELRLLSPFIILSFGLSSTFIAWDLGMMLIEHWHSTVFPIFFSFGNLYAGTAALMFIVAAFGRAETTGSMFGPDQIRCLGMLVTGFTVLWLYFFWAQFFVVWFGNLPRETDALWPQMYGHYAPYHWAMMTACFFLPFVALVFAFVKRSMTAMLVLGIGINVGIWLHKYLTVVPVFSPDDRPFDQWLDVLMALGLLAGFLTVLIWLAAQLPIYSEWEIARGPS